MKTNGETFMAKLSGIWRRFYELGS